MAKIIEPQETKRAAAFDLWMHIPMPMVTCVRTLDVTNLIKVKTKLKCRFNMLLCWCIGKAAAQIDEFYMLPAKKYEDDRILQFDQIAVSLGVKTLEGGICSCDIPFSYDLIQFNRDYLSLVHHTMNNCKPYSMEEDAMVINTIAMVNTELDCMMNMYDGEHNNPTLIWGKYRKRFFKTTLPVSFQFHRTQMDNCHATAFFDLLQAEINKLGQPVAPTTQN